MRMKVRENGKGKRKKKEGRRTEGRMGRIGKDGARDGAGEGREMR